MIIEAEWPGGTVMDVLVRKGDEVEEGQELILLETADSEHTPFYVVAPQAGTIKDIFIEEGDFAEEGDDLLEHMELE